MWSVKQSSSAPITLCPQLKRLYRLYKRSAWQAQGLSLEGLKVGASE